MSRARFIVLEGVDRCGKTLQSKLLAGKLAEMGREVGVFSTPDYGGFAGQEISDQLRGKKPRDALGFEGLLIANRYVVASRVRDALATGRSAICVRWWQSAILYGQVSGHDVVDLQRACACLPEPDLNILVDVDPMVIADRYDRQNFYEQDLAVQVRLVHAYRRLWDINGGNGRWVVVDGSGAEDVVTSQIVRHLTRLFS